MTEEIKGTIGEKDLQKAIRKIEKSRGFVLVYIEGKELSIFGKDITEDEIKKIVNNKIK